MQFFNLIRLEDKITKKILPVLRLFRYNIEPITILSPYMKAGNRE